MQHLKILIVEDEAIPAINLSEILVDIGYLVTEIASDYDKALHAFKKKLPDLVLIDINLGSQSRDGIQLAESINALQQNIPIIFISANYDKTFRERAYQTEHADFLVKPYNESQIELSVERALRGFNQPLNTPEVLAGKNHIFIKDKNNYVRVDTSDIYTITADRSTSYIHTLNKKHVVSTNLNNLLGQFDSDELLRIHRSHAVNLDKVTIFNEGQISLEIADKEMKLQIGPKYKADFLSRITKIKSS